MFDRLDRPDRNAGDPGDRDRPDRPESSLIFMEHFHMIVPIAWTYSPCVVQKHPVCQPSVSRLVVCGQSIKCDGAKISAPLAGLRFSM